MKVKVRVEKFTLEVEDTKSHIYLLLEVDNFPIDLIDEFTKFHGEKMRGDTIFRALPLMREWLRNRGHTARVYANPEKPFYFRWKSSLCLGVLESNWRQMGLRIFDKDLKL